MADNLTKLWYIPTTAMPVLSCILHFIYLLVYIYTYRSLMLSTHLNRIQGRIYNSERPSPNLPESAVSRVNPGRVFHDGGGVRVWPVWQKLRRMMLLDVCYYRGPSV